MKSPPKEKPGAGELTGQIWKRLRETYRFPDLLQATFHRLGPISPEAPDEKSYEQETQKVMTALQRFEVRPVG